MLELLSPSPSAFGTGWLSFNKTGLLLDYKLHRSFDEQLDILRSRGMSIANSEHARRDLENIGYYRLAAYWYPFREIEGIDGSGSVVRSESFRLGTSFEQARALWTFDHSLRLLILEAMEYIEVALRVRVSHRVGEVDPFAHLHASLLDTAKCSQTLVTPAGTITAHDRWIQRYEEKLAGTHDDILRLYRERWTLKSPIWVAVELLDFGMLSTFFRFMTKEQQSDVARTLGISQGSFLANWVKVLNHVRNMCAHHSRVWNQPVTFRLQRIPIGRAPLLDPLNEITGTPNTRIYSILHLSAFLLRRLGDESAWTQRVLQLLQSFPNLPSVSIADMGAPAGWEAFSIWTT